MLMKLAEIELEAPALTGRERASLAAKLIGTLPFPEAEVSDDEVERREKDLESGRVVPISHEEFVRKIEWERHR
jgi:hypothetical protein